MVRLSWAARLAAMKALEPLDAMIAGWAGRSDIADNIWKINRAPTASNITCRCNTW